MNNNDRRIRKTKKALRDALATLLMEKDLRSITIKELTDTADIHRATFYAHYQDVYDLYDQLEDSVISELDKLVKIDTTHTYEGMYTTVVNYVYENAQICKMFLCSNGNRNFQDRVGALIEENYLKIWSYEEGNSEITEEMRLMTIYHIRGCISIIGHWVEGDFSYPKKKIIKLLRNLDDNIERILL